jgi:hypothetical protein
MGAPLAYSFMFFGFGSDLGNLGPDSLRPTVQIVFSGGCRRGCTYNTWIALYKIQKRVEAAMHLPSALTPVTTVAKCREVLADAGQDFDAEAARTGTPSATSWCQQLQLVPPPEYKVQIVASIFATVANAVLNKGVAKMSVEEKLVARMIVEEVRANRIQGLRNAISLVNSWASHGINPWLWDYPDKDIHGYTYNCECRPPTSTYDTLFGQVPKKPAQVELVGQAQAFAKYLRPGTPENNYIAALQEHLAGHVTMMVDHSAARAVDAANVTAPAAQVDACERLGTNPATDPLILACNSLINADLRSKLNQLLLNYDVTLIASKSYSYAMYNEKWRPFVPVIKTSFGIVSVFYLTPTGVSVVQPGKISISFMTDSRANKNFAQCPWRLGCMGLGAAGEGPDLGRMRDTNESAAKNARVLLGFQS